MQRTSDAGLLDRLRSGVAEADDHLSAGRAGRAGRVFGRTLAEAFDRQAHFDTTTSPLATDPGTFLTPVRESATGHRLRAPRGRHGAPTLRPDRPTRVLLVTRRNANFLGQLRRHLDEHPDTEIRYLDLAEHLHLFEDVRTSAAVAHELLTGTRGVAERFEGFLRPHLDWADVMFVEWCTAHAALLTMVDPRDTRVVLRLHSFEVFTPWPHLVDFSRVDDLLFVSDHLRDFAVDALPGLPESAARLHALPLALELVRFRRDKAADARFTLGLVGWSAVAKDPIWALDVLTSLRQRDERYRLILVGNEFDADASDATREYAARLFPRIAELRAEGAIELLPQTDDVPAALERVGTILSSSVRESFHAALVEGAASGAVPVVRDWPFFAGRPTSARTLFPDDWVVGTPEQAAERILETTADEQAWRLAGAAASAYAIDRWDWSTVKHDYDRFLLGC